MTFQNNIKCTSMNRLCDINPCYKKCLNYNSREYIYELLCSYDLNDKVDLIKKDFKDGIVYLFIVKNYKIKTFLYFPSVYNKIR